ncbi:MAG: SDR family oxidoreductase [Kofleriaceae bacterium]|nr:SDR family oxidoreductase [Kofleriaceae bacterium]
MKAAIEVLRELSDNRRLLADLDEDDHRELLIRAGQVARPGPYAKRELAREVRKRRRKVERDANGRVLAGTGIRAKRRELVFQTPNYRTPPELVQSLGKSELGEGAAKLSGERNCYICKESYSELHSFYDSLCISCADYNYGKRTQRADLSGRIALITGARVKIGYQAAILLLRAGAKVIVTTRFPRDAARRYAAESDAAQWAHRLEIHGLDLRHIPSVETFARNLCTSQPQLDFIINNACQTVRRPAGFYQHLLQGEAGERGLLPACEASLLACSTGASPTDAVTLSGDALPDSAELSQAILLDEDKLGGESIFPQGLLDQDLQQVDRRKINSWRLPLADVSTVEVLEVQLVNTIAPFLLNARLKELMMRRTSEDKHIVNVSAVEGQFYRSFKTDKHPHTNMAKAALNMMTRTSAVDYVKHGIHMNSVDTGWVSDEDPADHAARKEAEHGFHPPLDIVDGAARIVDPIFSGMNSGNHQWGLFLKDYKPTAW